MLPFQGLSSNTCTPNVHLELMSPSLYWDGKACAAAGSKQLCGTLEHLSTLANKGADICCMCSSTISVWTAQKSKTQPRHGDASVAAALG